MSCVRTGKLDSNINLIIITRKALITRKLIIHRERKKKKKERERERLYMCGR